MLFDAGPEQYGTTLIEGGSIRPDSIPSQAARLIDAYRKLEMW